MMLVIPSRSRDLGFVPPACRGQNKRPARFSACHEQASDASASNGGERGIRTPVPLARDPVFKTGAIGHSAISPRASRKTLARLRPECQAGIAGRSTALFGRGGSGSGLVFEDGRDGIVAGVVGKPVADGGDEVADAVAEGQRQEQGDEQDGEGVGGRGYSVFPFK